MSMISVFLIGIGLSMDAFAVSIAKGMTMKKQQVFPYALLLAFFFGSFQALMPFLGWWAGSYFQELIAAFDHWIAFALLSFIGIHMIHEALHPTEDKKADDALSFKTILLLAIATSIDALAVGVSFAFLQVSILSSIALIGTTTFLLSFAAVYIGNRLGALLETYAGLFGGIILIIIGCKILIEHLFLS